MASAKGRILRLVSRALTRGSVVDAREVGGFQRLVVRSDVRAPAPGSKVQLLLPSDDVRTYTPIASQEGVVLLGWRHAGGPGATWMSSVRGGEALLYAGPQRSLELRAGPVVIVGDETSVAVAASYAAERPGAVHAVLQARSVVDVREAARSVGLDEPDVVAAGDVAATVDAVRASLANTPGATVAITGGAELVVGVRDALRRAGVRDIKTKTYWVPGKTGLD